MALEPMFAFELSPTPLAIGEFQLLTDADERWMDVTESPFGLDGTTFAVLYGLPSSSFLFFVYGPCKRQRVTYKRRKIEIWDSAIPAAGSEVSDEKAVAFLIKARLRIPERLEAAHDRLRASLSPPPRPLENWVGKHYLERRGTTVDALDLQQVLQNLVDRGIRFVQEVRIWHTDKTDRPQAVIEHFAGFLFMQYAVEPSLWWGDQTEIPPASVGVHDLPWPGSVNGLPAALQSLQSMIEGPMAVLSFRLAVGHPDGPTWEERTAAKSALINRVPELETQILALRSALGVLRAPKPVAEPEDAPAQSIRRPSDEAIEIYALSTTLGLKQAEIVTQFREKKQKIIDQSKVSRSLQQVKKWLDAGNQLPGLSTVAPPKIQTMDPAILDRGPRVDKRSKPPHDSNTSD
jgi:hypothetical protein